MSRKDAILNMRRELIKRRDSLRRALVGDLNVLNEFHPQTAGDMPDAAFNSTKDDISSKLIEVETGGLDLIEHALDRMQSGNYGVCEGCEVNIPMARLSALPYATRCIKCQREAERQPVGAGKKVGTSRFPDLSDEDSDLSMDDIDTGNL